jgi:hypothetical protein
MASRSKRERKKSRAKRRSSRPYCGDPRTSIKALDLRLLEEAKTKNRPGYVEPGPLAPTPYSKTTGRVPQDLDLLLRTTPTPLLRHLWPPWPPEGLGIGPGLQDLEEGTVAGSEGRGRELIIPLGH